MPDANLTQLIMGLTDALRKLPPSKDTDEVRARTIDVISHLEMKQLIPRASWNLEPR